LEGIGLLVALRQDLTDGSKKDDVEKKNEQKERDDLKDKREIYIQHSECTLILLS
jgi:hypothetical protein